MFTKVFLSGVRLRAVRNGVWYRVLDQLERGILTLASRVVDEISDSVLGVELVKIVAKIRDATVSRFVRHAEAFGVLQARVVCGQALGLGYSGAGSWASDEGFARYLGFIDFNQPVGWGSGTS
jgi:hypothetical protein